MELEPSPGEFKPVVDPRGRMEEPLPVRLVAVGDVHLRCPRGNAEGMDPFYVRILEFVPGHAGDRLVYRADNYSLVFTLTDGPIVYDDLRPTLIEVQSLAETEKRLLEAELEYKRQRGLLPGQESLLMLDPARNWVEIVEFRRVM